MTSNDISYLEGYLNVVTTLNTFCNDGKDYSIHLLNKDIDINTSLQHFYQVKGSHFISESIVGNWTEILIEELRPYFCQMLTEKGMNCISEFKDNIETILKKFVLRLKELVGNSELYKINIEWDVQQDGYFENYNNDYIFDLNDKCLYLHLGGSD